MLNKSLNLLLFCVVLKLVFTTNEPKFISKGGNIQAKEGDDIELQCLAEDLGENVILWKFNRSQVLFAGNLGIHRDDVYSRNDKTGALLIKQFSAEYSGVYTCQVSTVPPQEIKYHVHIIDEAFNTQNSSLLCDGQIQEFTGENGTITSYNCNQYTDNLFCQFRISVNLDEIIIVEFEAFPTYGYLTIHHGRMAESNFPLGYDYGNHYGYDGTAFPPTESDLGYDPRLYKYSFSGKAFPSRFDSLSNELYLNYSTNSNNKMNRFKLNFKSIKKVSVINLTESEGIVQSPEYPNKYPNGIDYTWKISAPPNYQIKLDIIDFEIEESDYLEIIEVSDNKSVIVVDYSGLVTPDRFLSDTNQLILKFISDKKYQKKGFRILYKFVSADLSQNNANLCERGAIEFTGENGTINSYNYANENKAGHFCQFRIRANIGEIIIVNFETLRNEFRDSLSIYNSRYSSRGVMGMDSFFIDMFSGKEIPRRIVSMSNYLFFNYTSELTKRENGFILNYKSIKVVSDINLTDSEGIIHSPEYPNNYTRGLTYSWRILAPANKLIKLDFNDFYIAKDNDFLKIIGVSDNKNLSLDEFSGSIKPETYVSNTNELILKFISDIYIERKGFEISYEFVKADNYSINRSSNLTPQSSSLLCEGRTEIFTSPNGTITSYNYPNEYRENRKCQFRIIAKFDELIIVNFEIFNNETSLNWKIYNSYSTSNPIRTNSRIESSSNFLFFNFNTDINISKNIFKLNYKSIKKVSVVTLTENEGIIQSPEYPNNYPSGIHYSWKIIAPANNLIILDINNFETEFSDQVLRIFQVSDIKNKIFAIYSGSVEPATLLSNTNELLLIFKTGQQRQKGKGFEISYKFINADNYFAGIPLLPPKNYSILCGTEIQEYTSDSGKIASYNYPNRYRDNLNCHFLIIVESDQIIIVDFETFDTQTSHDVLNIHDGRNTSGRIIGRYSGSDIPARIVSWSNYLYFHFSSDNYIVKNGFELSYTSIKKVSVVNLTESEGIIKSPIYPNYYPQGINYTWNIFAPPNNLIALEFHYFLTEATHDVLQIFEVADNKTRSFANYSGSVKPTTLTSYSNQILLIFKTDLSVELIGFIISYKFVNQDNNNTIRSSIMAQNSKILCGYGVQEFTGENGTITSYNYPGSYANNLNCQFRITVEPDKIIIVNFETFTTQFVHDILRVYDGRYSVNETINIFSGYGIPRRIVSKSNNLYFSFITDSSGVENGFKFNYKSTKKFITVTNLTESAGIIQSPEYPNDYPPGINYTWKIYAPINNLIRLEFNDFNTEDNHDVLEIVGVSNNKSTSVAKYSGSVKPATLISFTNQLILKFKSDNNIEHKGFEMSYKFISTGADPKYNLNIK